MSETFARYFQITIFLTLSTKKGFCSGLSNAANMFHFFSLSFFLSFFFFLSLSSFVPIILLTLRIDFTYDQLWSTLGGLETAFYWRVYLTIFVDLYVTALTCSFASSFLSKETYLLGHRRFIDYNEKLVVFWWSIGCGEFHSWSRALAFVKVEY